MGRRVTTGRGHSRTSQTYQRQTFGLNLTSDVSAALHAFADDVREKALRPAAYAMAHEFYREMKYNVPVATGQLQASIYHWHDSKRSNPYRQVYSIGPNKKKAPHWALIEFGTVKMAARPYIRTTWTNKLQTALHAGKTVLAEKIKELINARVTA